MLHVVAMALLVAAAVAMPTFHVTPNGLARHPCGGSAATPCSLAAAIRSAPPHSRLVLGAGTYRGAHYVTRPLRLDAASAGAAVMDGETRHRPLSFDNVPVMLDGLHFRNGFGERAGCVLATFTALRRVMNNITRCVFRNCTGVSVSPTAPPATAGASIDAGLVGGAVAIIYTASGHAASDVSETNFTGNFARADVAVAGGMMVSHDSPVQSGTHCHSYSLRTLAPELERFNGIWRAAPSFETVGGAPVFVGPQQLNVRCGSRGGGSGDAPVAAVALLATCTKGGGSWTLRHWGLFTHCPGDDDDSPAALEAKACAAAISSEEFRLDAVGSIASVVRWGVNGHLIGESILFRCEDLAKGCDVFQTVRVPPTQTHRGGMFAVIPNRTFNDRPVFRRIERLDPTMHGERNDQFVYYCHWNEEWIFSELAPEEQKYSSRICTRGIASFPTQTSHPALVRNWRYWNVREWETSSGLSSFALQCRPPPPQMCPIVEVVNRVPLFPAAGTPPDVASVVHQLSNGPYLLTEERWNGRPTYATPANDSFVWFCGRFGEWVISAESPLVPPLSEADAGTMPIDSNGRLGADGEVCLRSVSSHRCSAMTPYDHGRRGYSTFVENEWRPAPSAMSVECAAQCPLVSLAGAAPRFTGVFESIGLAHRRRVFRRITAPTPVGAAPDAPAFIFYTKWGCHSGGSGGCWIIADSFSAHAAPSFIYAVSPSNALDLLATAGWTSPALGVQLKQQPAFACEVHRRCTLIEVAQVPGVFAELRGSYRERVVPGRNPLYPVYQRVQTSALKTATPRAQFIYYCSRRGRWVLGPDPNDDACAGALLATQRTPSTSPVQNTLWNQYFASGEWLTELMAVVCHAEEKLDDLTRARLPVLRPQGAVLTPAVPGKVAKRARAPLMSVIRGCVFSDNTAIGDGAQHAAGGLLLHLGVTPAPTEHVVLLRRLSFDANEAAAATKTTIGAGGLTVRNAHPTQAHIYSISDTIISDNTGPAGGAAFAGAYVTGLRVSLLHNRAMRSGGGFAAHSGSNVTLTASPCIRNVAAVAGGCGKVDKGSNLAHHRSRIGECTAPRGSVYDGGSLLVHETKYYSVTEWAISACFLHMSSTELVCGLGKPTSATAGFSCVPDKVYLSPTPPQRRPPDVPVPEIAAATEGEVRAARGHAEDADNSGGQQQQRHAPGAGGGGWPISESLLVRLVLYAAVTGAMFAVMRR